MPSFRREFSLHLACDRLKCAEQIVGTDFVDVVVKKSEAILAVISGIFFKCEASFFSQNR